MRVVRRTAALTVFLLIGGFLFNFLQAAFVEKSSYPQYRAWKAGEDIPVVVLGNSHADNGIRAGDLSLALSESAGGMCGYIIMRYLGCAWSRCITS